MYSSTNASDDILQLLFGPEYVLESTRIFGGTTGVMYRSASGFSNNLHIDEVLKVMGRISEDINDELKELTLKCLNLESNGKEVKSQRDTWKLKFENLRYQKQEMKRRDAEMINIMKVNEVKQRQLPCRNSDDIIRNNAIGVTNHAHAKEKNFEGPRSGHEIEFKQDVMSDTTVNGLEYQQEIIHKQWQELQRKKSRPFPLPNVLPTGCAVQKLGARADNYSPSPCHKNSFHVSIRASFSHTLHTNVIPRKSLAPRKNSVA